MVKITGYVCEGDQISDSQSQIKKDSKMMGEVRDNATSEEIHSQCKFESTVSQGINHHNVVFDIFEYTYMFKNWLNFHTMFVKMIKVLIHKSKRIQRSWKRFKLMQQVRIYLVDTTSQKNAYLIQLFRKVIASYIFIFFKYHLRLKITFA